MNESWGQAVLLEATDVGTICVTYTSHPHCGEDHGHIRHFDTPDDAISFARELFDCGSEYGGTQIQRD